MICSKEHTHTHNHNNTHKYKHKYTHKHNNDNNYNDNDNNDNDNNNDNLPTITINKLVKNELSISKLKISNYDMTTSYYTDIQNILYKGCQYYPHLIASLSDYTLFDKIKDELDLNTSIEWSKHHKILEPEKSNTFNLIVNCLKNYFNITVLNTRLNYYLASDFKPFHHDSHAYSNGLKEDITIGCSLGSSRLLDFKHVKTNKHFTFTQNNGDVFCFDYNTNIAFQHGIPKLRCQNSDSERISIILWGASKV